MKFKDLTGTTFGDFQVLHRDGYVDKKIAWACLCICGEKWRGALNSWNKRPANCGCRRYASRMKDLAPLNRLMTDYVRKAADRHLRFELAMNEFHYFLKQTCFYCGARPSNTLVRSRRRAHEPFLYNGLDRVNNKLGYTIENVVSACKRCNRAKNVMSAEEFLQWITDISAYQKVREKVA